MKYIIFAVFALAGVVATAEAQRFYELEVSGVPGQAVIGNPVRINLDHVASIEPCSASISGAPPLYACFYMDDHRQQQALEHQRYRSVSEYGDAMAALDAFLAPPEPEPEPEPEPLRPTGTNTAPIVTVTGPATVVRGESVELTAVVVDPDEHDTHSYQWGLSAVTPAVGGTFLGANMATVTYTPDPAGAAAVVVVVVSVEDYRGAMASESHRIDVTEP